MATVQPDQFGRMTVLSQQAFDMAASGLSARDAANALLSEVPARRFADVAGALRPGLDLKSALTDGLCANDPARNRESVGKKVRDWLNGKYQPTAREDLLELCFTLKLTVDEADAFLATVGEEGLHWRDPRELAYAYALRKGMTYPEAKALLTRVLPQTDDLPADAQEESFTPLVHAEAAGLETEEELRQYLSQARRKLGTLHNSAYRQMMALLSVLEQPDSAAGQDEERYSTRSVVEHYLDQKLPPASQGKRLGEQRRAILAGWPDEVTLSRMKNRSADVTRKVLMLLFLATDGGSEPEPDWDEEDEEIDEAEEADEAFRSSYVRMNQMLSNCGYRTLDPRNPFDWVAIYCMRVDTADDMEGLNERLAHVLDILFHAAEPEA